MVATAFLWSIAGLFIKVIDWHPFAIAGMRSLVSSLVVLAWLKRPAYPLVAGPGRQPPWPRRPPCCSLSRPTRPPPPPTPSCCSTSARSSPPSSAPGCSRSGRAGSIGPPLSSSPPAWCCCSWTSSAAAGCWATSWRCCSGLTFSFCFVFLRMQKDGSPLESMLLAHWFTAAIGLAVSLFLPLPVFTWKAAGAIAMLGIFQVGVAAILFSAAIKRITAVSANLIAVIEPVFNPLWVFLALGERPGITAIAGGALIIAAVSGASVISARRRTT
ncbi:MAG: DMT family transporter [Rhodopseudomonas palustris]|nr:DMT family transporter [Rhodopseudomonas palustris]